jgi:hypothetical protein
MKCVTCGRVKGSAGCMCRPSRTGRKNEKVETTKLRAGHERVQKSQVRKRDGGCRFPRCGCKRLGLIVKARPEVSHEKHKGMGGNPIGDRSMADIMVELCNHRHQDGIISRHKGTLRPRFLTELNYNGAVEWYVASDLLCRLFPALGKRTMAHRTWADGWTGVAIAREVRPRFLAPLADWQDEVLSTLSRMEL